MAIYGPGRPIEALGPELKPKGGLANYGTVAGGGTGASAKPEYVFHTAQLAVGPRGRCTASAGDVHAGVIFRVAN